MRPDCTASSSAMATEAAEVLPYLSRLMKSCSGVRAEAFADGVDDPPVGLVRDDALDLRDVEFAAAQRFLRGGVHGLTAFLKVSLPSIRR